MAARRPVKKQNYEVSVSSKAYVIFCFEIIGAISQARSRNLYVTFFHWIDITKKILRFSFLKVYIRIPH